MIKTMTEVHQQFTGGQSLIKSGAKKRTLIEPVDPTGKAMINWTAKDYVFYFASMYKSILGSQYNVILESDLKDAKQILTYFQAIGADQRFHTRAFIDWCFENSTKVIQEKGYFTLRSIKYFINEYVQMHIMEIKSEQKSEEYDFVAELNELHDNMRMLAALKMYGIPIVATFLYVHKKYSLDKIESNINMLSLESKDLCNIAKMSIMRSPYPSCMLFLEWRSIFKKKFMQCTDNSWWRDNDYSGTPHVSYEDVCNV